MTYAPVYTRQFDAEKPVKERSSAVKPSGKPGEGERKAAGLEKPAAEQQAEPKRPTRFFATISLDPLRVEAEAGQISDEILAHLDSLAGADVKVTLEIHVDVPDGIPEKEQKIVNENCRTIGFDQYGFAEE
jgi:hypothetical protein